MLSFRNVIHTRKDNKFPTTPTGTNTRKYDWLMASPEIQLLSVTFTMPFFRKRFTLRVD